MRKVFEDAPEVEAPGGVFLGYYNVLGVHRRMARETLEKAGIGEPRADAWYPRHILFKVLKQIDQHGDMPTLFQVGRELATLTAISSELKRFEDLLQALPEIYLRYQRHMPVHEFVRAERRESAWLLMYHTPWPSQGFRGYLTQMFRRYTPGKVLTIDLVEGQEDSFDRTFRLRWDA